jgi:dihydrofolate reductase
MVSSPRRMMTSVLSSTGTLAATPIFRCRARTPIFKISRASAELLREEWGKEDSPFRFVTEGVESAIQKAKQVVGNKNVGVGGSTITQQALKAGLLDEIQIDLVPILLGAGIRLFDHLGTEPI